MEDDRCGRAGDEQIVEMSDDMTACKGYAFYRIADTMRSISATSVVLGFLLAALSAAATENPNFLIIIADDCTYNDLPLYGGANAKTPNASLKR